MWNWIPQIAGTIAGPVSDYFQEQENRKAASESDRLNRERADAELARNFEKQEEFAKNSIRWKVEDAKAAGLSPLAAIGASGTSFSPVSSNYQSTPFQGNAFSKMGQNISRATAALQTADEREMQSMQIASMKLDLDGKALDNQIRAAQLNKTLNPGNPPFPSDPGLNNVSSGSALVTNKPLQRTMTLGHQEGAAIGDVGYAKTKTGYAPVPSTDVKERIEDQIVPELMWSLRNQILPNFPNFSPADAPPAALLPQGASGWQWSYTKQEWQPKFGPTSDDIWQNPMRKKWR